MEHSGTAYLEITTCVKHGAYTRSWHAIPSADYPGEQLWMFLDPPRNTPIPAPQHVMEIDGDAGFDEEGYFGIWSHSLDHLVLYIANPEKIKDLPSTIFNFFGLLRGYDFGADPNTLTIHLEASGAHSTQISVTMKLNRQPKTVPGINSLIKVNNAVFSFVDPRACIHFSSEAAFTVIEDSSTLVVNKSTTQNTVYKRPSTLATTDQGPLPTMAPPHARAELHAFPLPSHPSNHMPPPVQPAILPPAYPGPAPLPAQPYNRQSLPGCSPDGTTPGSCMDPGRASLCEEGLRSNVPHLPERGGSFSSTLPLGGPIPSHASQPSLITTSNPRGPRAPTLAPTPPPPVSSRTVDPRLNHATSDQTPVASSSRLAPAPPRTSTGGHRLLYAPESFHLQSRQGSSRQVESHHRRSDTL